MERWWPSGELWLGLELDKKLGHVHVDRSPSSGTRTRVPTSSNKHELEFACIPIAAVHIDTNMGYL